MKKTLTLLLLLVCSYGYSQTMTEEEETQRSKADFQSLLNEVKTNDKKGCLCKANEFPIFSFKASTGKTASICIAASASTTSGYLVYRYGTNAKIELTYPQDTSNSFSKFSYSSYSRGGGKQNAAMYLNKLAFTNGGYSYQLYDDWNSEDDHFSKGISVTNNQTNQSFSIDAKGNVTGSLFAFKNRNLVKESDEL